MDLFDFGVIPSQLRRLSYIIVYLEPIVLDKNTEFIYWLFTLSKNNSDPVVLRLLRIIVDNSLKKIAGAIC
jgi:hypothetical protein